MKINVYILLFLISATIAYGQTTTNRMYFNHTKKAIVNFENITQDFSPSILVNEMPKPGSEKMVYYNYPETKEKNKLHQKTQNTLTNLNLGTNFFANPYS